MIQYSCVLLQQSIMTADWNKPFMQNFPAQCLLMQPSSADKMHLPFLHASAYSMPREHTTDVVNQKKNYQFGAVQTIPYTCCIAIVEPIILHQNIPSQHFTLGPDLTKEIVSVLESSELLISSHLPSFYNINLASWFDRPNIHRLACRWKLLWPASGW